jgi:hypothetical protein
MFHAAFSHTSMSAEKSRVFDGRQIRVDEGLVLKPRTQLAGARFAARVSSIHLSNAADIR